MITKTAAQVVYLTSLAGMVAAYEEIAANRMQKIKNKVLYNRDFMAELNNIFQRIKSSYKKQAAQYKILTAVAKNSRRVLVFISANTGLYGDIIARTFSRFSQDLKEPASDGVIIGQLGKRLFEATKMPAKMVCFDFPDTTVDAGQIKKMMEFLRVYQSVVVYHGLFRNIVTQEVATSNISGDELLPKVEEKEPLKIIFEPSLGQLLDFFEKEIFASLLVQTIYESQLAKFSSRMAALETASHNIEEARVRAIFEENRERHGLMNKKQQAMLIGRWRV